MSKEIYQAKEGYIHRSVAGEEVLISVGENVANFNGYVELNESAAHIWDMLKEPRTAGELAEGLSRKFGIALSEAEADIREFLAQLRKNDMVTVL